MGEGGRDDTAVRAGGTSRPAGRGPKWDLARRYGAAVLCAAAAALLRLALNLTWGDKLPYLVFFPAVLVAALYGGFGPGVLAMALSTLTAVFLVIAPAFRTRPPTLGDFTGLAAYCLTAALIVLVAAGQRRARRDAEASAAAARAAADAVCAAADAVRAGERRLAAILEGMGEAFLSLDRAGRVTYANRAAAAALGKTPDRLLGRDPRDEWAAALGAALGAPAAAACRRALAEQSAFRTECFSPHLRRWVEVHGYPLEGGLNLFFRDVTGRKAAETERAALYEREHRIAEALQRSLLVPAPAEGDLPGLSVATSYEPARDEAQVGGDFYDVFALDGGRVALVVGDMTGKGLDAAATTGEVKFVLRAFLREDPDPARALARLNRHRLDDQRLGGPSGGAVACLVVAVVDTRTGDVACAAGGAEPPLVLRRAPAGGDAPDAPVTAEHVAAGGPLIGADAGAVFPPVTVRLAPGDLLLLFTDGLTEARRGRGTGFFGPEGVARAAAGAAGRPGGADLASVGDAILGLAKAHAGGVLHDDVCLLLVRYDGAPPDPAGPPAA